MITQYKTQMEQLYISTLSQYQNRPNYLLQSISLNYYNQSIPHIHTVKNIKTYNTTLNQSYNNAVYNLYKFVPTIATSQQSFNLNIGADTGTSLSTDGTMSILCPFKPLLGDYFTINSLDSKFIYEVVNFETNPHLINKLNTHKITYRLAEIGNIPDFINSLRIVDNYFYSSFFNNYFDFKLYKSHELIIKNIRTVEQFINSDDILSDYIRNKTSIYNLDYVAKNIANPANITITDYYNNLSNEIEIIPHVKLVDFLFMEIQSQRDFNDI